MVNAVSKCPRDNSEHEHDDEGSVLPEESRIQINLCGLGPKHPGCSRPECGGTQDGVRSVRAVNKVPENAQMASRSGC